MGQTLDPRFFKPFVDGALITLKMQCSIEAKSGKPFIKGQGPEFDFDLAGIIGLTSQSFTGTIALLFPKSLFLAIINNMLGEQNTEITKEMEDGAAELLNIIFGHAKKVLNAEGHTIQKAIPTIIRGTHLQSSHLTGSPVFVLPFETQHGTLCIEISTEGEMKNV